MIDLQKKEKQFRDVLTKYLPENVMDFVVSLFMSHKVSLVITNKRKTKLGTFTQKKGSIPVITVNHDLNPYQFLIVLVHEFAHFYTWEKNQNKRMPSHGQFWKNEYAELLVGLIKMKIFPDDIRSCLVQFIQSNFASSKAKFEMENILLNYGKQRTDKIKLLELEVERNFIYNGMTFKKLSNRNSRCICIKTNDISDRKYSFHLLVEVQCV